MQISRRDALRGATAAAVITGAATVPLAIKAAGVKAALASASDARIFILIEEHDRTFAEMRKAHDRCGKAAVEKMPPHLRHVKILGSKGSIINREAWDATLESFKHPEVKTLWAAENRLKERCREIAAQISQTEATTLEGVCAKMRFAMQSDCFETDIVRSVAADLERLAGEARS